MQSPTEVRLLSTHFGWILEAFVKESAEAVGEEINIIRVPVGRREYLNPSSWNVTRNLKPKSEKLVFIHHETFIRNASNINNRRVRLLLTHFDSSELINSTKFNRMSSVERIVVQNNQMKKILIDKLNIEEAKIVVGYGAVNRNKYFPLKQKTFNDYIIIVGDCKPRKNPRLISDLVVLNPSLNFVIHGIGWEDSLSERALQARNLRLVPFNQEKNPVLIRQARLLLSLSTNEGGPIPILEALASGTPVFATDTGFSSDFITAESGIVVPVGVEGSEISPLLEKAMNLKSNCWERDLLNGKCNWRDLGLLLYG